MIGEARAPPRLDARAAQRREEFFRIADAGEGQHPAVPCSAASAGGIGLEPCREKPAGRARARRRPLSLRAAARSRAARAARASCAERRAQRAGRKHAAVADAAAAIDHRDRESLCSDGFCRPSSITMMLAPAARAAAAPATRSRATIVGAARASSSGSSPTSAARCVRRVDPHRARRAAAIAAAQKERPLAGGRQQPRDRDRGRRLAGAAEREIADADDRNAGARPRLRMRARRRPRHRRARAAPAAPPQGPASATRRPAHASPSRRLEPQLHQIRLERRQRPFERAAERVHRSRAPLARSRVARVGVRRASAPIAHRQLAGVGHLSAPPARVERGVDLGEIPDMRPVQDRGAELDRLDRILAAMLHQRTADEHDRREPVEQAELAERVGDVDVGRRVGQLAARAQRESRPAGRAISAIPAPRSGWRGAMM